MWIGYREKEEEKSYIYLFINIAKTKKLKFKEFRRDLMK